MTLDERSKMPLRKDSFKLEKQVEHAIEKSQIILEDQR